MVEAAHLGWLRPSGPRMMRMFAWMAAIVSFLGALIHLGAIFGGAAWYEFFGAPPMVVRSAREGTLLAPVGALIITALMAMCALYALSALGVVRRLVLLKSMLVAIAAVTLLRALSTAPIAFMRPELITTFEIVASMIWGLAGVGFAAAFLLARRGSRV